MCYTKISSNISLEDEECFIKFLAAGHERKFEEIWGRKGRDVTFSRYASPSKNHIQVNKAIKKSGYPMTDSHGKMVYLPTWKP